MSDTKITTNGVGAESAVASTAASGIGIESADKVERIRELIFGAQMREYGQKFEAANREIARLSREVERLSGQLRDQETAHKRQLREETERLAAQLHEQAQRQTQHLQELGTKQSQELTTVDQKQTQQIRHLDQLLHTTERDLSTQLRTLTEQLNQSKVDRTLLGELLIHVGTSLRTNDAAPLSDELDLLDQLELELR
jgi:phage host-nuclease inhibitor protein Gam